jgi:hypothetical protein
MAALPEVAHELFDAALGFGPGGAAIAQVLDKARIVRGKAPELGPGHPGFPQEYLDLTYQHGNLRNDSFPLSSWYVPIEIQLV